MEVKKLDSRIKDAFMKLGFSEEEVREGCWLLERNNKPIAWIALHKFLERVAQKAHILFDMPQVLNCQQDEVAVCVNGSIIGGGVNGATEITQTAWSIGEASTKNCKNDYRWAMAEKRAKDRVILKLLGIAGDMYSEEEADEFKQKPDDSMKQMEKDAVAEKRATTQAVNKAIKEGTAYEKPKAKLSLEERYNNLKKYLEKHTVESFKEVNKSMRDSITSVIDDLRADNKPDQANEISEMVMALVIPDDKINY